MYNPFASNSPNAGEEWIVKVGRKTFRYYGFNFNQSPQGPRFHLIGADHVLLYTPPEENKCRRLTAILQPQQICIMQENPGRWAPGGKNNKTIVWPDAKEEYVGMLKFSLSGSDQTHKTLKDQYVEIRPIELSDLVYTTLGLESPPSAWVDREQGLSWDEENQVLDIALGAVFNGVCESGSISSNEGWVAFVIAGTTIVCAAKYISGWTYDKKKGFPVRIVAGTTPKEMTHSVQFQNGDVLECFIKYFPTPQRFLDQYKKAFRHADLQGNVSRSNDKASDVGVNIKQLRKQAASLIDKMRKNGEINSNEYNWQELAAKVGYPPGKAKDCGKSLSGFLERNLHPNTYRAIAKLIRSSEETRNGMAKRR